ncbi:unnamed protein product [Prunus armeniaca]|uniref:Uncharacterized protein n=1 Tax=Prunus armeniaca TaxID=36596 RepID=A0A6J5XCQ9_PRUAR|nr:unnamed protein product [Prunus armeniaca]
MTSSSPRTVSLEDSTSEEEEDSIGEDEGDFTRKYVGDLRRATNREQVESTLRAATPPIIAD